MMSHNEPHAIPLSPTVPRRLTLMAAIVLIALVVPGALPASAHPADMYLHTLTVRLTPGGLDVGWTIVPGPLLTLVVWSDADQNQDEIIQPEEAENWLVPQLPDFAATLDGTTPLAWQVESITWPTTPTAMQVGDEAIQVHLRADWPPDLSGDHQLALHNHMQEAISVNWYALQAEEGVGFQTPNQENGQLEVAFVIAEATDDQRTYWDSGMPAIPADEIEAESAAPTEEDASAPPPAGDEAPAPEQAPLPQSPEDRRPSAILTQLVREPELSVTFYLVALVTALVLGALHALTPGHGKTVVAAYLVGSRGTTRHALALGTIVTATHTGSVFALGLVTLLASQYILPTDLFPLLEITSGVLILGLGASLLIQRWRAWQASRHGADHDHSHDHHHHHDHAHVHTHHAHGHTHHGHDHHHPISEGVTWRSLITLGISGGLVPCPDAIAILLVAIAINRIALGLTLIVAFSLGLAVVLIAIGIAMVHSRHLVSRFDAFNRLAPAMPVVSAVVVLVLGAGLTIGAVRNTGFLTPVDAPTAAELATATPPPTPTPDQAAEPPAGGFDIEQARILYVRPTEEGRHHLVVLPLDGGEPQTLNDEPDGIWDYALSPDGETIVYSLHPLSGSGDLWAVDVDGSNHRQLLACPEAQCCGAIWSPDGERLIYERRDLSSLNALLGAPSLWWVDVASGQTNPLFQDSQMPGYDPRWSPDGEWLSYVSPTTTQIQVYNLLDGRSRAVPSQSGQPVIWHPEGDAFLMVDIWREGENTLSHLLRFEPDTEELLDLNGESLLADQGASWSPDGEWIAVVRGQLADTGAYQGDHLWLMRPDGSDARQLTTQERIIHGTPVWSPDGNYLLFRQYDLDELLCQGDIWVLQIETGEQWEVASPGSQPAWLP